jgi:hypothetical protein
VNSISHFFLEFGLGHPEVEDEEEEEEEPKPQKLGFF